MHEKRMQKFLLLFARCLDESCFFFFLHSVWNNDTVYTDDLLSFIQDASLSCICIAAGDRSFHVKKGTEIISLKIRFFVWNFTDVIEMKM